MSNAAPKMLAQHIHYALESASKGFRVFPVVGKHPAISGWKEQASTDPDTIVAMFETVSRRATGHGILSGSSTDIVVVDIDQAKGGFESLASLGDLPPTLTHVTGGGGRHLFYRHPGEPVGNKVGVLPGVDIRDDGGFVVGPGSEHASGGTYSVAPGLSIRVQLRPPFRVQSRPLLCMGFGLIHVVHRRDPRPALRAPQRWPATAVGGPCAPTWVSPGGGPGEGFSCGF